MLRLSLAGAVALAATGAGPAVAQSWFGGGASNDAAVAELTLRIQQLEERVRQLTGEVETLRYQLGQRGGAAAAAPAQTRAPVRQPLAATLSPVQQPLAAAPRQPAASPGEPTSLLPPIGQGGAVQRSAVQPNTGAVQLGAPPRPLGTIPQSLLRGGQELAPGSAQAPGGGAPAVTGRQPANQPVTTAALGAEQDYTAAYAFVLGQDFESAEYGFRTFLERHPNHELAGNAQYWLGESFYARGQYRRAAQAFLRGYQTYRSSPKAPDSLLKLGMTLAALGETGQACASFDEISQRFPGASAAVRERAVVERDRVGC